jgi:hypothetical protein
VTSKRSKLSSPSHRSSHPIEDAYIESLISFFSHKKAKSSKTKKWAALLPLPTQADDHALLISHKDSKKFSEKFLTMLSHPTFAKILTVEIRTVFEPRDRVSSGGDVGTLLYGAIKGSAESFRRGSEMKSGYMMNVKFLEVLEGILRTGMAEKFKYELGDYSYLSDCAYGLDMSGQGEGSVGGGGGEGGLEGGKGRRAFTPPSGSKKARPLKVFAGSVKSIDVGDVPDTRPNIAIDKMDVISEGNQNLIDKNFSMGNFSQSIKFCD